MNSDLDEGYNVRHQSRWLVDHKLVDTSNGVRLDSWRVVAEEANDLGQ